jgi:hypothetical protein
MISNFYFKEETVANNDSWPYQGDPLSVQQDFPFFGAYNKSIFATTDQK